MRDKVLVTFSTHNAPAFLECLFESMARFDAGYDYDVLIYDCENTDAESLKLLERYSAKHIVRKRPNLGRAQAGYQAAWRSNPDYAYYFFMHDDSVIMRDQWLSAGVKRLHDKSLEDCLEQAYGRLQDLPVGKVGYCSYEWGTLNHYLRTGYPAIFRFIRPLLSEWFDEPSIDALLFQHCADDRTLYTNQCLSAIEDIHHIEQYRLPEGSPLHPAIHHFFYQNYPGRGFIEPKTVYNGYDWEGYQTVCEFFNDIKPMLHGFRTHNLLGDGHCQEELGYQTFWGNSHVAHWGAHNTFKRLAYLLNEHESTIRHSYESIEMLNVYQNMMRSYA